MNLSTEERLKLRDKLFEVLKANRIIVYTNKSKLYRINNTDKFKNFLIEHEDIKVIYTLYISQFRSEREAKYCLTRKDDISNHLCPVCNKPCIFYEHKSHIYYRETCGKTECREALANSEESKAKGKRTCLEKYGTDHQLKNNSIKDKIINTNLERRGVKYSVLDLKVRDKAKETNLERYGVENPFASPEIQDKIKQTNLNKYGVENPMQNEEIQKKSLDTFARNHPPSVLLKDRDIIKLLEDMIIKIDDENNEELSIPLLLNKVYYNTELFTSFIKNLYTLKNRKLKLNELSILFDRQPPAIKHKLESLNLLDLFDIKDSQLELKFIDFLLSNNFKENIDFIRRSFNLDTDHNTKQQTDIIFPNLNIGFEINDTHTHNVNYRNSSYHINKTILSKNKNIRLIHIWEWEILKDNLWNRLSQWILNLLNINKEKIGASKCICKLVSINEEKEFLNMYHLQGYIKSEICIGLYDKKDNTLLQLMSFCKSRFNKNYEYELLRLCTRFNYTVIKGYLRLLENFKRSYNPKSIISYCNLDKFTGEVYTQLGFNLLRYNQPSVIWYNDEVGKLFLESSLLRLGADKLLNTNYGKGTDNEEIAIKQGYKKVYNCGQNIYVIRFE